MSSIYVILNKESGEMLTTPSGKWHWPTKSAAGNAYTLHMRSPRYGIMNDSIPRLRDDACPYYAKEIELSFTKENRSKTLSIREEIQS